MHLVTRAHLADEFTVAFDLAFHALCERGFARREQPIGLCAGQIDTDMVIF